MNVSSTVRRTAKHPSTKRAAWIVGLAAAAAAAVGSVVYFSKTASASTSSPKWIQMQPDSTGSSSWPMSVTLPPNAVFAVSDVASDPQLSSLVTQLNQLATNGQVLSPQGYKGGTKPPKNYPSDGLGTNAYRATGTVSSNSAIVLPTSQTTTVWMIQMAPQNYLALVTDKATVTQWQSAVATAIAQNKGQLIVGPGIVIPPYTSADVDGDPTNPKWVALVAAFQKYVDSGGPLPNTGLPGFPSSLRTDGVFDYATMLTMANS